MNIDWQEVLTNVFATVGGGGVVLGAAGWLTKKLIDSQLARETEAFKIRLQGDANVEVERLKSSLQMTTLEHQVRFSKLHEKRAEVIAEVYAKLADVYAEVGSSFTQRLI